jgi:hypothetical protein
MRDMKNVNQKQAKINGWNIIVPFAPDCEVIAKAVYEDGESCLRIMKSTKRFKVPGGWIYNISTEVHSNREKPDQVVSVAEAVTFVPEPPITITDADAGQGTE